MRWSNRGALPLLALGIAACNDYELQGKPSGSEPLVPRDVDAEQRTDVVHQRPLVTEVDVLWVIDNSSSMANDQESLAAAFPSFMNFFIGIDLDFHIGVVSTDMYADDGQGRLREAEGYRWIDNTHPDPIPFFQFMATLGTDGSGDEMARAPVYSAYAVEKDAWNAGFFRDTAILSTIVISDEDDSSDLVGVGVDAFVDWYRREVKPDPSLALYSTIVGPTPDGCSSAQPGAQHIAATQGIGGLTWNICDSRWDELLEELAIQSAGLKREFYLSELPVPETLDVEVQEEDVLIPFALDVDYTYDATRNSITFLDYLPQPGAEIHIRYDVAGTTDGG